MIINKKKVQIKTGRPTPPTPPLASTSFSLSAPSGQFNGPSMPPSPYNSPPAEPFSRFPITQFPSNTQAPPLFPPPMGQPTFQPSGDQTQSFPASLPPQPHTPFDKQHQHRKKMGGVGGEGAGEGDEKGGQEGKLGVDTRSEGDGVELRRRREEEQAEAERKAKEVKKRQSRTVVEDEYERMVLVSNTNCDDSIIKARSLDDAITQMTVVDNLPPIAIPRDRCGLPCPRHLRYRLSIL
ncbi:uncharacterized protein HKW66_Vig0186250 [Vigna angularis]|uniref:Uncharacterized protein n=1 Tax=Phaseolus angularis TaxID=3914 RepID=A0A8T0KWJ9_PHAAN|nr:uncharacterized protein HKW66_Vig0186250 [Vigna angularis]